MCFFLYLTTIEIQVGEIMLKTYASAETHIFIFTLLMFWGRSSVSECVLKILVHSAGCKNSV